MLLVLTTHPRLRLPFLPLQGSASVHQKKGDSDEAVEVGKLGPSDYFGASCDSEASFPGTKFHSP